MIIWKIVHHQNWRKTWAWYCVGMWESVFNGGKTNIMIWFVGMLISTRKKNEHAAKRKKTTNSTLNFKVEKFILCVKYICLAVTPRHSDCLLFFLIHACSTSMTCDAVSRERTSEHPLAHSLTTTTTFPHRRPCADYYYTGKININKNEKWREEEVDKKDHVHAYI